MPIDIRVPSVGESITEGTLSRWFQKDGATVRADEPLYELETEKATTEIASPATGVLHIGAREGDTVAVGSVIARIEETAGPPAPRDTAPGAHPPAPSPATPHKDGKAAPPAPVMPAAQRLAAEKGVDVTGISGTGRGSRITKEDVQARSAE